MQLRAWLVDSEPEVWRLLVVDPRLTLEQLHTVLQHAFGWTNSHLHQFHDKDGTCYAIPSRVDHGVLDERKLLLAKLFDRKHKTIEYEYDFGDSWEHADNPDYPQKFSALGIRIAVNYVAYSMTH